MRKYAHFRSYGLLGLIAGFVFEKLITEMC